jgi:hypothetical protein
MFQGQCAASTWYFCVMLLSLYEFISQHGTVTTQIILHIDFIILFNLRRTPLAICFDVTSHNYISVYVPLLLNYCYNHYRYAVLCKKYLNVRLK